MIPHFFYTYNTNPKLKSANPVKYKKRKEKKRFNFNNKPFATLKASSIPFPPKIPHDAVWRSPPKCNVFVLAETTLPSYKHIKNPIWHNPMQTKQTTHHSPQLISYGIMKKKMFHQFHTSFTHTAPIQNNTASPSKIICRQNLP